MKETLCERPHEFLKLEGDKIVETGEVFDCGTCEPCLKRIKGQAVLKTSHRDEVIQLSHSLSKKEIEWFKAGSALNSMRPAREEKE